MIRNVTRVPIKFTGKEDVVVVPLHEGDRRLEGPVKKLDLLCRSTLGAALQRRHFAGERAETLLLAVNFPRAPKHVLLVGLGKRKDSTPEHLADAGGAASQTLKKHRFKTAHLLVADPLAEPGALQPFLKGFLLAQYTFAITKTKAKRAGLGKLALMSADPTGLARVVRSARIVAEHNALVRDLVNTPANTLTPSRLAEEAKSIAKSHGIACRVMGRREIEKLGMGAVLSVAKGSSEEPRFITLSYNKGRKDVPRVCLVGKGVTFDSGGLSIKPWQNMNEMKGDMAGAAVVLATTAAAARMQLPIEIVGLIPCVENLPSSTAFRPGDVIETYTGKTIEIISTDAEGRLILSDAIGYACEFDPDVVVDFATLTGAVVIALGTRIAGVMGNSQKHIDAIIESGRTVGEPVWQLPMDDAFATMVKGDISDYKNYSGRDGSSITAAALLGEFAGDTPWLHVDIAGTFWSDGSKPSYHSKGATGYGVDLALAFLRSLASKNV